MSDAFVALLFGAPFVAWAIVWWFTTAAAQTKRKVERASERKLFSISGPAAEPASATRLRGRKIAFGRR